jgi:hypothetical protein
VLAIATAPPLVAAGVLVSVVLSPALMRRHSGGLRRRRNFSQQQIPTLRLLCGGLGGGSSLAEIERGVLDLYRAAGRISVLESESYQAERTSPIRKERSSINHVIKETVMLRSGRPTAWK